jgi:hypothetical protein
MTLPKKMVVEKKENLLGIDESNKKKKVETVDFLLCKAPRKWLFERWR